MTATIEYKNYDIANLAIIKIGERVIYKLLSPDGRKAKAEFKKLLTKFAERNIKVYNLSTRKRGGTRKLKQAA